MIVFSSFSELLVQHEKAAAERRLDALRVLASGRQDDPGADDAPLDADLEETITALRLPQLKVLFA